MEPLDDPTLDQLIKQSCWMPRLAEAILRDRALADDAVQQTWLAALEKRGETRAVSRPWLARVLVTRALKLLRGEGRRRSRERAASIPEPIGSPEELALVEERRRRVVEAVLALEEPYRTTVVLRFWSGLSSEEIGKRTDTASATVRMRLKRALAQLNEKLSRTSDQRGAWALTLFLDALKWGAPASVAAVPHATVAAAAALVLALSLGVTGWLALRPSGRDKVSAPQTGDVTQVVPEKAIQAPESLEGGDSTPERVALDAATVPGEPLAPSATPQRPTTIKGRCVAEESGEALAGCRVSLRGRPWDSSRTELHNPNWHDPDEIVTGVDGCFEIVFAPPRVYNFDLGITCEGRVRRTGWWQEEKLRGVEDLGDIPMPKGHQVAGRIIDTEGRPIAGAALRLEDLPLSITSVGRSSAHSSASDEEGRFSFPGPLPSGQWEIRLTTRTKRYSLITPTHAAIAGAEVTDLTVVVEQRRCISGVVVDESGQAVPHVYLETASHRDGEMESSWTRDDGSFVIYGRADAPEEFQLESCDPGPCEPLADDRTFRWGMTDIRLVMKRARSLELTVVEAGSDNAVEEYHVTCYSTSARSSREREARLGGEHPGGKLTVDKVWRGENLLRVIPSDPALLPSDEILFTVTEDPIQPIRVEVERLEPLDVFVTDTQDKSVPGAKVELIRTFGQKVHPSFLVRDPRDFRAVFFERTDRSGRRLPDPEVISTGETDFEGHVELFGPKAPVEEFSWELALRVTSARFPPSLQTIEIPEDRVLQIVVSGGAALRGTVVGDALREPGLALVLWPVGGGYFNQDRAFPITETRQFAAAGIEPGSYRAVIRMQNPWGSSPANSSYRTLYLQVPNSSFTLVDGETTEVILDLSPFSPASLHGTATLDGKPLAWKDLLLRGQLAVDSGLQAWWYVGPFETDEDGSFEALELIPGNYSIAYLVDGATDRLARKITCRETIELRAGVDREWNPKLIHQILRLQVIDEANGQPLAGGRCLMRSGLEHVAEELCDERGWVTLDPAPVNPFGIEVDRSFRSVEEVAMPEGEKEASLIVKVKRIERQ
ncbi:MAG: sigma-70 family RNA polymerase sigma factor [Planctomycetota bacterium]